MPVLGACWPARLLRNAQHQAEIGVDAARRPATATRLGTALLALMAAGTAAHAADRAVRLEALRPVRAGVAAMPAIADPVDAAERRINAALRRLDAAVRAAAAGCRTYGGRPGGWRRAVDAPMRGPGYLSLVIRDESFCDGAHPNSSVMSVVYDLRTGAPVDWSKLLPPGLTGRLTLLRGSDGTRVVTLTSARLYALYLASYRGAAVPDDERESCREAVAAPGRQQPPAMMAWLDAAAGGLAVQFQLPNVAQACAEAVVIPAAILATEGADPMLLASLR